MVERVRRAALPTEIIVATTTLPADDPIRDLCADNAIRCHSGHPTDLLDRHYAAALEAGADIVVKIPSDCPLIDPTVIDKVIDHYICNAHRFDFVSNLHPPSYPDGQDVEVMPIGMLATAHREANRDLEREHTTPFFWENPERFRIGNVRWGIGLDLSMSHRWTIDYEEDYLFLSAVYDALYSDDDPAFGISKVLAFLNRNPEVATINAHLAGVNWYRNHLGELRTIDRSMTRGPVAEALTIPRQPTI
jgi:spore coat polysaccharide biosynthesis protein SpsF